METSTQVGKYVYSIIGVIGGALSWFFGSLDGLLIAVLCMMIVDYVTGVLCAIVEKRLSSDIGRKGLCKKAGMIILIGCLHILDEYVIKSGTALRDALMWGYIANEGVSLLENFSRLGVPIPDSIKKILMQLKDKDKDKDKPVVADPTQEGNKP